MQFTSLTGCILVVSAVAAAAPFPHTQESMSSRVVGRVSDREGLALPGASVTLTAAGMNRSVRTDEDGRFVFDGLQIEGPYTLHTEMTGFRSVTREGLTVKLGEIVNVDLALRV